MIHPRHPAAYALHAPRAPRALLTALAVALALCAIPAPRVRAQSAAPIALTIGSAARLAAERGAGPEAARLRAAQADARVRQRRADLLPQLALSALDNERTFNSASLGISIAPPGGQPLFDPDGERLGPVHSWDFRGTLRQSVYDPATYARLKAARASAVASATDADGVAQQAAAAAAAAYVRALRAEAHVDARLADSTLAAELVAMARDRLAAGTGNALDVTRARAQLSTMRTQLIAARSERDRAGIELQRTLGLPIGARVTLGETLAGIASVPSTPTDSQAIATARVRRADLRAVDEQSRAVDRQVTAIRAERLPALSLYADQGSTGKATDHLLSTYSWGIQLSVPVFDGFRRDARIDEQRFVGRELEARHRDLLDRTIAEVRTALVEVRAAAELLDAATERFTLAEQEVALARDRFAAGVADNGDVVVASIALNAARTQLIDARAAAGAARVSLGRAEGTLTDLP